MNLQVLAIANSFGDFCKTTCKAKCCKTGTLLLENDQDIETFKSSTGQKITRIDGLVEIHLQPTCSFLKPNYQCSIHAKRPQVCQSFPLFLRKKTLFIASWCPAIQQGLLEKQIQHLTKEGIHIVMQ